MSETRCSRRRFLTLGPDHGWHAEQLASAAARLGHQMQFASYESISAAIGSGAAGLTLTCDAGSVSEFDAILTRTMSAASMEKITFRLAALHALADRLIDRKIAIINPPRALEWAIDKFASLARLASAGFPTPPTRLVQSRNEAMDAFEALGGDCIIKPIFGGEGRGVMRIQDKQLAWYSFSALEQLDAVLQIQAFIPPGGTDKRLLVIGDRVFGVRRTNNSCFRSNVSAGAACQRIDVDDRMRDRAVKIARLFGLVFASVDMIDNENGPDLFLEVNAIPGWKGAQGVIDESIAEHVIWAMENLSEGES